MSFSTRCLDPRCLPKFTLAHLALFALLLAVAPLPVAAQAPATAPADLATIITIEGRVEVLRAGTAGWQTATLGQRLGFGDKVRTGDDSRAAIQLANASVQRLRSLTVIALEQPRAQEGILALLLERGALFFKSWAKPETQEFRTPTVAGAIRGTEFHLVVADAGSTVVTLIDGEVNLASPDGTLPLKSGEQATIERGRAPTKTAVLETTRLVQWYLYYPGVLEVGELGFTELQQRDLVGTLTAYQAGDLPNALRRYPAGRDPATPTEKIYRAGLLLSVGEVAQAEALLTGAETTAANSRAARLAAALREVIAAVQFRSVATNTPPQTASEWVARSYLLQSRFDLAGALQAAREAVKLSPTFGFAHARVAELEFSHGRTKETAAALEQALQLSPRNAQALALQGFVRAAQNRFRDAQESFEQAIAADPALGNGWLGRGLIKFRRGQTQAGLADLQIAAALEPNRSLLRSYLGKGYAQAGDRSHAERELELAKSFDRNDPTPWLYSALEQRDQNRINQAVRDFEQSAKLNDNRQVYRSRMLLDQDSAVRGANLAGIFRDAGMADLSIREAAKAVASDYSNHSAHRFLANSFEQLRDPKQINLRYETPAFAEYLIANLLAPVGAGVLSATVSQQEYSRLFDRDHWGVSSKTDYSSRGDWTQDGAQYGTFGRTSYSLEGFYRSSTGERPNNDFEQRQLSFQLKQQLTPQDLVYAQVLQFEGTGGDLLQRYNPETANLGLRTTERQSPTLLVGYSHEWSPESRSLVLFSRVDDSYSVLDPQQGNILVLRHTNTPIEEVAAPRYQQEYRNDTTLLSGEAQHILKLGRDTAIVGFRVQDGEFRVRNSQTTPNAYAAQLPASLLQNVRLPFFRASLYGYYHWEIFDRLTLIGGLAGDYLQIPENFRAAPVSPGTSHVSRLSPKIGAVFSPWEGGTLRAAYAQSLGGAGLDQSIQIEPTQIAGFLQSYRSLIPESLAGSTAGARFETFGAAFEQALGSNTFLGVSASLLASRADQQLGGFEVVLNGDEDQVATNRVTLPQTARFRERSLVVTLDQLVGDNWIIGSRYRLVKATLDSDFTTISDTASLNDGFLPRQHTEALLHQWSVRGLFHHRCGLFARGEAQWNAQENLGLGNQDFIQLNFHAGFRSPNRRWALTLGLVNATDRDYKLNPVTLYSELPHGRTATFQLQINY